MKKRRTSFGFAVVDLLASLCVVFIVLSLALDQTPQANPVVLGPMTIELTWDMGRDDDVDLWVQTPDDVSPVGYKNSHGRHADLDHDDLGRSHTIDSRNIEIIAVRSAPPGEFTINAVLYDNDDSVLPVPIHLQVFYKDAKEPIFDIRENLTFEKQEKTLLRFTLGKNGAISNVNYLQRILFGGG